MTLEITPRDYVLFLKNVQKRIAANKEYVTELDASTGDGDHWVNMNVGFSKLVEAAGELEDMKFSAMFKKIALIMMNSIGGSSGILYGSGYLKAAIAVGDTEQINERDLLKVLEAILNGIMERGQCRPGFKTMVDTLYEAVEAYREALDKEPVQGALEKLKEGAIKGMNATKDMEAVKGRAYYQADKGVGHLDPGAVTMCYQIEELVDTILKERKI